MADDPQHWAADTAFAGSRGVGRRQVRHQPASGSPGRLIAALEHPGPSMRYEPIILAKANAKPLSNLANDQALRGNVDTIGHTAA